VVGVRGAIRPSFLGEREKGRMEKRDLKRDFWTLCVGWEGIWVDGVDAGEDVGPDNGEFSCQG